MTNEIKPFTLTYIICGRCERIAFKSKEAAMLFANQLFTLFENGHDATLACNDMSHQMLLDIRKSK